MTEREYRERARIYGYGSFVAKMGAKATRPFEAQVSFERNCGTQKEVENSYTTKTCQSHPSRLDFGCLLNKSGNKPMDDS